jgi:uncharacterized protein (TIGR02145 family)
MPAKALIARSSWMIMWLLLMIWMESRLIEAATIPMSQIPIGKVVSVGGLKFVKIGDNLYMAAEAFGTMQGWSGCASLPNPACMATGTCQTTTSKAELFTQGPILTDSRDGKKYDIRKFPDGKCWMADNLRFGGATDACKNKKTFSGNTTAAATNRFGAGTYGDCRDPAGGAPYSSSDYNDSNNFCLGQTFCGYHYDWQAAMQASGAYYNASYTTPSYPHQGICPTGWHIPTGGAASEFVNLDGLVGSSAGHAYPYFWKATVDSGITTTDPWKTVYSGFEYTAGSLIRYGSHGHWWSATQAGATSANHLYIYEYGYTSSYGGDRSYGFSIRCVQN